MNEGPRNSLQITIERMYARIHTKRMREREMCGCVCDSGKKVNRGDGLQQSLHAFHFGRVRERERERAYVE